MSDFFRGFITIPLVWFPVYIALACMFIFLQVFFPESLEKYVCALSFGD